MILYRDYMSEIPIGSAATEKQREEKIIEAKTLTMTSFDTPALRFIGIEDGAMVVDMDNADGFKLAWLHIPACCSRIRMNTPVVSAISIHGNCRVSSDYLDNTKNLNVIRFDKDVRDESVYSNLHAGTILPAELSKCDLIDLQYETDTITAELFGVQSAVKAINLPRNIRVIADNAFAGWGLEKIAIPASIEEIGSNVFMDCKNLKKVIFESRPQNIGCDLFEGCNLLEQIEIEGKVLTVSEFAAQYEERPLTIPQNENIVIEQEFSDEDLAEGELCKAEDKEDAEAAEAAEGAEELVADSGTVFADNLIIGLPEAYMASTDAAIIGKNRALVAVLDDDNADLGNPYAATESITVLYGKDISSVDEADDVAASIGLESGKILIDNPSLNVRYSIKESGENLSIFLALICTESKAYPTQIFFNNSRNTNVEGTVNAILTSIKVLDSSASESVEDSGSAESDLRVEIAQNTENAAEDAPVGVSSRPGEEPREIKRRIDLLFEKLDAAYPDKVIVGLHKDHKEWGRKVTAFYRQLGYPDGKSFLEAYGYTAGVSGRPSGDAMAIIDELKRRYPNGPEFDNIADLKAANPDLASKFSNLQNQANKFFGMPFAKYLVQEGLIAGKTDDQCENEFETLKSRYEGKPFTGTLNELKSENDDIDWSNVKSYFSRSGSKDTFKDFLINQGILLDKKVSVEDRLAEITEELKNRYPVDKKFTGNIKELAADNTDLLISDLNYWTMQVHKESATNYLVRVGIMEAPKSAEEKLAAVTEALKERYASGEQKIYYITELCKQNPDLPINTIGNWSQKVFNQSASEYLMEQGILSKYDLMEALRLENERREAEAKAYEEQRQAEAKAREERLAAEMAAPIEIQYYEPQIYIVDEIEVSGAEAEDWEYVDNYWRHEGEIYLKDYHGQKKHIILPTHINGKKVNKIIPFAFKECAAETIEIPGAYGQIAETICFQNQYLKTLIIGEGITEIGDGAFFNVPNLENVYVSQSVEMVYGDHAFQSTKWYDSIGDYAIVGRVLIHYKGDGAVINVPYGVNTVGEHCAECVDSVRKVFLPNSVTTLCENAFCDRDNENIQEFIYTDSLTNIGLNAFGFNKWTGSFGDNPIIINNQLYRYKVSNSQVVIPAGITKICDGVFKENNDIEHVVFPSSLKSIGEQAFAGCRALTSISLPDGIERLEKQCFYGCKNLGSVSLPDSLTVIGCSAFKSCSALTEITLGDSVEEIGEEAFAGCQMLRSFVMNDKVRTIGNAAFKDCTALQRIELPDSIVEISGSAFSYCASLSEIIVPGSVKKIGPSAFIHCKLLEEIILPKTVGQEAFYGCTGLKRVSFNPEMTEIAKETFARCTSLIDVVIPDAVTEIRESAFSGCTSLRSVTLPIGFTMIGKSAFSDCVALESIIIPDTVKAIEDNAFKDCTSLTEVAMPDSIEKFGMDVFTNSPYMKKAFGDFVIMGGVLSKYLGADKEVTIPDNVTTIGEKAFSEACHVETIIIPDTVKTIANNVFGSIYIWEGDQKPQLKKLVIGNGVISIGDEAFASCKKLTEVVFGTGLSSIGQRAFFECEKLKSIDLSKTLLTEIKQEVFKGCYNAKKLVLPSNVEIIGNNAFYGIELGVVQLPKSVKKVEPSAFDGVSELVVYDTIDPDAVEASEWKYDERNGSVNSTLACAMCGVPHGDVEGQGNTSWYGYHITVLSADTGDVRYRIFCDSEERDDYRAMMLSAWGKNASFNFDAYDDYFMKTRGVLGRAEMAFCRIQYPEGLSADHRANYEAYLERCMYIESSAKRNAEMIGHGDSVEKLAILDRYKAIDDHNIGWIREIMKNKKANKCLAYLDKQIQSKEG